MKFRSLLVVLLLISLLAGCAAGGDVEQPAEAPAASQQEVHEPVPEVSRLVELKQHFAGAGFEIGENELIAYDMIHATNGMKFTLDGELIEIYEYDLDNLTPEAQDTVQQAEAGSISFSGFNVPVVCKDGLMLVRHDEHSQGDKIVEAFNNF